MKIYLILIDTLIVPSSFVLYKGLLLKKFTVCFKMMFFAVQVEMCM